MAETALLVTIGSALASGILKEVATKAIGAASESSTVAGLKSAIFGDLEDDLRRVGKELSRLDYVLSSASLTQHDNNKLLLIWLEDVKEAACFADNLLDEIAYDKIRRKVSIGTSFAARLLPRPDVHFRKRIAGKIKNFFSLTADIYKEAETTLTLVKLAGKDLIARPATLSEKLSKIRENPETSIILGRKGDEELIVTELCSPDNDLNLSIVAVVGRSGVGKTTLARIVYDNPDVCKHFGKRRTWIFVSDQFKLERFLDEMLQSVTGSSGLTNKGAIEVELQESLKGEKGYLLILDDVWNTDEDLWKSVESSLLRISRFTRCKVLVTTQSFDVARKMGASLTHELKDLDDDDAWELFYQLALANKTPEQISNLEDVGRQILSKCSGLPLAIRTMGSLLRSMDDRSQWESIESSEMWGLSVDQSKVMPWLIISFQHLDNTAIKQCFVHCSIIIEKGKFVLESEVIRGWMAQGFIQSTTATESDLSLEDICQTYVSNLVATGLLQRRIEYNDDLGRSSAKYDPGVWYLWTHDLVHDLARFISKSTVWVLRKDCELNTVSKAQHLRLCSEGTSECQYNLPKGKTLIRLRTLICMNATLSVDFADQAKFLRDMRLIKCGLKEVPSSIGGLKHLRYLSFSGNPLRHLPESITTLYHLQTLDLEHCYSLDILPQKITKLLNLRHILASYVKIPEGVGQLTCLRTLPPIVLGGKKGFKIKELKSLGLLSGELQISGLEHISCKEEAAEASLKTKARIEYLSLLWLKRDSKVREGCDDDDEIMEELQPHSNLRGIYVRDFGGKRLPSWLRVMHNLKAIILEFCEACKQLPTLGQLGSLEELRIFKMGSLEVIGMGFYHNDEERVNASSSSHDIKRRILFPRLKRLHLLDLQKLRDWAEPPRSIYEAFPCLEKLQLWGCPLLASAPTCFQSLSSLSVTRIGSGEAVMKLLTNTSNLTHLTIDGVEQLTSLFHPSMECTNSLECNELRALRTLEIEDCPNLGTIHGLEGCVSMEKLSLKGSSKLYLIPDLKNLRRLTSLTLFDFSQQMTLPEWLSCLSSLQILEIGGLNEEIQQLDYATNLPKFLKELTFKGWPKLLVLPEWLGYLFSLQKLRIEDCMELNLQGKHENASKKKHLPGIQQASETTSMNSLSNSSAAIESGARHISRSMLPLPSLPGKELVFPSNLFA
ncbi:hypothetical protein V2J09_007522 [Rumex salicifolius]